MSKRRAIKTTIPESSNFWSGKIYEDDLSIDWSESTERCWRCGCERNLQRAHIVPDSLEGEDNPSNIVLLCARCHAEGPNIDDPEIMWDWLKAYKVPFYDTFWGLLAMKEYEFIYKKSFYQDLNDILSTKNISPNSEDLEQILKSFYTSCAEKASIHFGQHYFNTATLAGIYRLMLKEIAKFYNVHFPIVTNEEKIPQKPWWLF